MTISPTSIRDYARAKGWVANPAGRNDRLYVFENPQFPNRQLVFPMDETVSDYLESIQLVAERLAQLEGVSFEQIVSNLIEVRDDILRIRITGLRDGYDSLPLAFATSAVTATQQLLLSAASTVLVPQVHHPRLSRTEAQQFLNAAKFQHTEHGSFVLKVSCPFDALEGGFYDGENTPFPRLTMLTVARSLRELVAAVEADDLDDYVEHAKNQEAPLVSSNFCEALTRLHDEVLRNSVELSVAWSPVSPVQPALPREPIRLQRDYFPRIEEVGLALRATGEALEDLFIGTVEQLNGDMNEEGRRSGQVVFNLFLPEGEVVRAQTNLTADQYEIADRVHMRQGAYVIIFGRLLQGRQPRRITDVRIFDEFKQEPPAILPQPDLPTSGAK